MAPHKQKARLQIVNECLLSGKYWSIEKLLNVLSNHDIEINKRTLLRDIELMKNCGQLKYYAPIKYSKANKGYHYTDPNYSIDKIPLREEDIKALTMAATTLAQYKYLPLMQEFTTIIDRVIRVVNRAKQSNHESILDFIFFEKTPVSSGIEKLDVIIQSIQEKIVLTMTYQKFNTNQSFSRIIHPYFLKEYRNRWYVVALDEKDQKIKTYGLDRIIKLAPSHHIYIENITLNKKDFFSSCVGISLVDQLPANVIVKFTPKQAYYLLTQSIHSSQNVISHDEDGLVLSLNLVINYEFIGILLSYGSDVQVIKPKYLADKIVEIANRIADKYS